MNKKLIALVLVLVFLAGCIQPPEPIEPVDGTEAGAIEQLPLEPSDGSTIDVNAIEPVPDANKQAPAPKVDITITKIAYKLYESADYAFQLEMPSHWTAAVNGASLQLLGVEGSGEYAATFIINYIPAKPNGGDYSSLQELTQAYKGTFNADTKTQLLDSFDIKQPSVQAPLNSLNAMENTRIYREYLDSGRLVAEDIYLLKQKDSFYVLDYLVFKDSLNVGEDYWKHLLESFRASGIQALVPAEPQVIPLGVPLTQEAIDYFKEIALGLEFSSGYEFITNWQSDPIIKINGSPTSMDLECLNNAVNKVGELSKTVKPRIADSGQNIDIYFSPLADFPSLVPSYVEGNWGYFSLWWTNTGELTKAIILISTDQPTPNARCHLIWEEFVQSLGLKKDAYNHSDSLFYGVYAEEPRGLSSLDEAASAINF
ncbi:DUF2927 domain-containing protein [archaeon]|nr:DUF2927 domain-containing protein [archaeon]